MTESEKAAALASIQERIWLAERRGLPHTANQWREYYATVAVRPADEIVGRKTQWGEDSHENQSGAGTP